MSFFIKPKKKKEFVISNPINPHSNSDVFQSVTGTNPRRGDTSPSSHTHQNIPPHSPASASRVEAGFARTPSVASNSSSNTALTDHTRVSSYSNVPTDSALDELFELLMDSMDIKENQRVTMRAMPPDSKWMMIRSQKDKENTDLQKRLDGLLDKSTPEFFVHKMKEFESSLMPLKNFTYLRVSLTTQPINWVKQFIYLNGMNLLGNALGALNRRVSRRESDNKIELEVVKSLKALLNTSCGSNEALQTPKIIYNLTFSIDSKNLTTRKLVADALIFLCCSEDAIGHSHVLEGMDKLQKFRQHSMRFEGWMQVLEATILGRGRMGSKVGASEEIRRAGADKDLLDYALSNMILINALIEIPEELEIRMHIRNQLNLCRLGNILKLMRELGSEFINLQILKFERVAELDMAELIESYNSHILQNMNDPRDVFEALLTSVGDTRAYDYFLSALQHMLLIRYDADLKTRYYQVIDSVITDIVLDQHYFENGYARQNGSVATIIAKFEKEEQLERSLAELKETKEQLHKVISRKNELELELSMHEDDMVTALKSRNHSLENLLRMSQQTCEALRSRYEGVFSELDGKLSRQDKQLKHVYAVFQKEIEERHKAEAERERLQIENELLKTSRYTEKSGDSWTINIDRLTVEVTRIYNERERERRAQQSNDVPSDGLADISFEEIAPVPMPTSRPGSNYEFGRYRGPPYFRSNSTLSSYPEKRYSIMPMPPIPDKRPSEDDTENLKPQPGGPKPETPTSEVKPTPSPTSGGPPPPAPMAPPSPPPTSGGLPPPPPPPAGPGMPPPPPLFGAPAVPSMPQRKKMKVSASVKLRQLQWEKLSNNKIPTTMWRELAAQDEATVDHLSEKGVFAKIEAEFAVKEFKAKAKVAKEELVESANDKISLVDPKRSHNMNIMLGSFKRYSIQQLHDAIITVDESVLTENMVNQFIAYISPPEEIAVLEAYTDDFDKLAGPEQFLTVMNRIYRYEARLTTISFKFNFMDTFNYLDKSISNVIEASTVLSQSENIPQLFQIILVVGNFMNGSGFRGGAYGFKVHTLTKLVDTKTADNKTTLVHFLVRMLTSCYPEVLEFRTELKPTEAASKVNFTDLMADFQTMGTRLKFLHRELEDYFGPDAELPPEDTFSRGMGEFYASAARSYDALEARYDDMLKIYATVVNAMGEDPQTMSPDEFFGVFKTFLVTFERCFKEVKAQDEKELKAEKRRLEQEAKERAQQEKLKAEAAAGTSEPAKAEDPDGVGAMDKLLESLRTGADFNTTRRYKGRLNDRQARASAIGIKAMEMLQEIKQN
ncbi:hypothetical protein L0F63_007271 [Massospora cicadina]|nr:hypothetical protein L0F63_007271 [Massospora cicadina]